jgi:hypothetical protein
VEETAFNGKGRKTNVRKREKKKDKHEGGLRLMMWNFI